MAQPGSRVSQHILTWRGQVLAARKRGNFHTPVGNVPMLHIHFKNSAGRLLITGTQPNYIKFSEITMAAEPDRSGQGRWSAR